VPQAVARAGRRARPTYQALIDGVRASPVVAPDETGWRIGGRRAWLWAFVGERLTVDRVAAGRGDDDAVEVLGTEDAGVLERDGWAPYRRLVHAAQQRCLAHLPKALPRADRRGRPRPGPHPTRCAPHPAPRVPGA
jgi:transposase